MKKNMVIYWISTVIVSLMMLFSAYLYLTSDEVKAGFVHLGFPSYFRVELAIAKILGAIVLLVPAIPIRLKEFAYFGFAVTFISAFIAHTTSGDPGKVAAGPLIFLAVLIVSFIYFLKLNAGSHKQLAPQ
jgi:DoxX-like protein